MTIYITVDAVKSHDAGKRLERTLKKPEDALQVKP